MKLSKRTIEVLKNFAEINNGLFIRRGSTLSTISKMKNLLAKAEIDGEFTHDFVVGDMRVLMQMIGLMKDPAIRFRKDALVVYESRKEIKTTEQTLAPVELDEIAYPQAGISNMPNVEVTFGLELRDMKDVLSTAAKMKFDRIEIFTQEGQIMLMTGGKRTKKGVSLTAGAWMRTLGETKYNFRYIFMTETWKLLPGDYTVELSSEGIAHFIGKGLEYWLVVEDDSYFEKE